MNKAGAILLVLCAAALAALYLLARPQPQAPAATAAPAAGAVSATVTHEFDFEIAGGQVRAPPALVARQGDRIKLRVRSDVADELHVHGYDLSAELPPGEIVSLGFVATRAGRFEVELHKAQRELGALEVHPR